MISFEELKKISRSRIGEAEILLSRDKFDGAIYLCGYAIEIALKATICKNLGGDVKSYGHIPGTKDEFKTISEIKIHDLDKLLQIAGLETSIKSDKKKMAAWSTLLKWNPEIRYSPIKGRLIESETQKVINAANKLLRFFWRRI